MDRKSARGAQVPVRYKTINASTLVRFYRDGHARYGDSYPEVLNPSALLDGVADMVRRFSDDGRAMNNVYLYVIDPEVNPERDPYKAEYVITITADTSGAVSGDPDEVPRGYAIRLYYTRTNQLESVSTVEDDKVVWSPDDMSNTLHPRRTRYYMGFVYLVCQNADGFDREPVPDVELTYEDLLELGMEDGEIPAEMIELTIPEQQAEGAFEDELPFEADRVYEPDGSEGDSLDREIDADIAAMGEDDTAILVPEDKTMAEALSDADGAEDEEDLITEFEELFE